MSNIYMTKICTSIEQSKKLIELGIDASTADMYIGYYVGKSGKVDGTNIHYYLKGESFGAPEIIPAWSLIALLGLVPIETHLYKMQDEDNYTNIIIRLVVLMAKAGLNLIVR